MKYEIEFGGYESRKKLMQIYNAFESTEECFKEKDLPRNIRNACYYSEAVRELEIYGADVDATGIYDDQGYDRIGYGRINEHEFIKNGVFDIMLLKLALDELAFGKQLDVVFQVKDK